MSSEPRREHWLLLIYRVPQDPPGRRTYVWRQLKQLGAVYLQQAAAILPDRPELRTALEALADRIRSQEGDVSLLETTSPSAEWERDLLERFNQARDAEYVEVVENIERFEDEIQRETRKAKITFAELEDVESDFDKICRWHERVLRRDCFQARGRDVACAAVGRGRATLDEFATAVYAHEGVQEDDTRANQTERPTD